MTPKTEPIRSHTTEEKMRYQDGWHDDWSSSRKSALSSIGAWFSVVPVIWFGSKITIALEGPISNCEADIDQIRKKSAPTEKIRLNAIKRENVLIIKVSKESVHRFTLFWH
jgi:hypothetical protein